MNNHKQRNCKVTLPQSIHQHKREIQTSTQCQVPIWPSTDFLYVYTIDANRETREQRAKPTHIRNMHTMQSPIEPFYPELWDEEHAMVNKNPILSSHTSRRYHSQGTTWEPLSVIRTPSEKFQKVPTATEEPTEPLHPNPPPQQHSLSEQGIHFMHCHDPIDFFDAIYPPHVLQNILGENNIYRLQNNWHQWLEPTYREMRSFIGFLLWTSLVQLHNRRVYFTTCHISKPTCHAIDSSSY